ncbi:NfeD family protein [Inhella crocodyli]|uniref:NfeD family protein n=1 Tax=Inhella crocodyli TaxID=2499851 RepID=A0A437LQR2_9BURK|nr:NfeD family protein [Inhella crocodyli]RVT87721.1 NfeD family protein [Inhella crocodyli]
MQAATLWWILAGALVIAELTSGTFYLLMLALAASVGALSAHVGLGASTQIALAAVTGAVATSAWYLHRRRHRQEATDPQADRNVNLDIGDTVQVQQWDDQGRTQVQHRGAPWSARFVGTGTPQPGPHRIQSLSGNILELVPH